MGKQTKFRSSTGDAKEPPRYILDLADQVWGKVKEAHETKTKSTETASGRLSEHGEADDDTLRVTLLAKGGYNDVWRATSTTDDRCSFVLRVPNEDSLKPHQVQNEVGWLLHVKKHCADIPVPTVYDYCDGSKSGERPFIAQKYVDAPALSQAWLTYTEPEKHVVAKKIAELIIRLGEQRFEKIAGMLPDGTLGPTVEGCKLYKGRDAFHSPTCYDIGPYATIKEYILAYYDKEIYYYSHASAPDLDEDLFEEVSPAEYVEALTQKQASLEAELNANPAEEPFVLCHNDLQGRNILMDGTSIAAVIDWEFAGSYPLSELEDTGVDVLEMDDEDATEECFHWSGVISDLVKVIAKERGWSNEDVKLLEDGGNPTLQAVRVEMFPEQKYEEEEVEGSVLRRRLRWILRLCMP
ncbi:uncharacterized protein LTR77_005052 [Saxophila tyrrhenica]|uniref:Aminoglycoside phosphotransferase domain-containing protein n=1 Tax=Saxophila tyrrhenica TaxID=1690608 RepID=A0AAV9PDA9_9PEZI|nr:hypothetical protein LTR77_005052 [Saxophila tyrrhenica]